MKRNLCYIIIIQALFVSLIVIGCSSKNSGSASYSIALSFTRIESPGLDPFKVTVTLTKDGTPLPGAALDITVQTPSSNANISVSAVTDKGNGTYEFTVTPDQTGEYPVTVAYDGVSVTRTPLVMEYVHPEWDQPISVLGLVNTEGYEDGVTITPDGEYLFVQTGPYRFSSIFVYYEPRENGGCGGDRLNPSRCEHPWINETCGTYTAPERPGFFNGRFSGTTQLHNANSWGVGIDQTPNYAISTMFYGFKRQSDGTFTKPFYMAFNDLNDAIINPYGLSFRPNADGSYTVIFALSDSYTTDYTADVYTYTGFLGNNINLGDYELNSDLPNPPLRGSYFPSTFVNLTDNTGTQGNPFLYYTPDGVVRSIWTDDEYDGDNDTHKISVYVLKSGAFPTGTWEKVVLPDSVNRTDHEAIQPTFVGNGLYFTEDANVVFAAFSGTHTVTGYATNTNWSPPVVILQKDTTVTSLKPDTTDIGKIMVIGEPTVATYDGKTELYFVYGYIRGIDPITGIADIDMQAGYVRKK